MFDFTSTKIVTDLEDLIDSGEKLGKMDFDIALSTNMAWYGNDDKYVEYLRKNVKIDNDVFPVTTPGDFAFSDVLIRRFPRSRFYIIDQDTLRIVFLGKDWSDGGFKEKDLKDLADVDVLVMPISLEKAEDISKIIGLVDPALFIPTGYAEVGGGVEGLASIDDFIAKTGLANIEKTKVVNLKGGLPADKRILKMIVWE
jgi:hypothetical protein